MKTKKIEGLLETRFSKQELIEIKRQAELEAKFLKSLQQLLSDSLENYMNKNKIGFNEVVRRLKSSPAHIAKIQSGQANLTLSSLAHLFALMGTEPKDIFKIKK